MPVVRGIDRLFARRGGFTHASVDLGREGELARAFNGVCQNAVERLRASAGVRELLGRPAWDRASRERWEATLAQILSGEFSKNPLFAKYRDTGDPLPGGSRVMGNVDINGLTPGGRYVCEEMSILHALAQQRVEDRFLQPGGGSLRTRGQYYVASGTLTFSEEPVANNTTHAWVVSSLTGNVIESTNRHSPYWQGTDGNHSFERVLAGYPMGFRALKSFDGGRTVESIGMYTNVYNTGHDGSSTADTRARFRLRLFEMGQLAHADTLSGGGLLTTDYIAVNHEGLVRYRELNGYGREPVFAQPSPGAEAGASEEGTTLLGRWSHYLFGPRP
jgi:hypothetical protein